MSTAWGTSVGCTPDIDLLYRDHQGWLRGWLHRRLGCGHQAADVAHDTFLRLLTTQATLAPLLQPRAFLRTTAQHLLIDRARRCAVEEAWRHQMSAIAETTGAYPAPEVAVAAHRALEELSDVLDRVAPKPRAAFLLHYLDGLTHEAAADQLGVSARMVRKYLAQVLVQCLSLDF